MAEADADTPPLARRSTFECNPRSARRRSINVEICSACLELIPRPEDQPAKREHHDKVLAFKKSARSCSLCRFILHALKNCGRPWAGHVKWSQNFESLELEDDAQVLLEVENVQQLEKHLASAECVVSMKHNGVKYSNKIVMTVCDTTSPLAQRAIWSARSRQTTDRRLALIRQWLDNCRLDKTGHPLCTPLRGSLPQRLIKCDEGELRLIATTGMNIADVSYATFSHCWGDKGCLKTTAETIDQHMKKIKYDDLPKSFQDAVRITKAVGLAYLWIDSLCIKQGDVRDWERESARMADIFQGSSLTIAATDSENAHGGCAIDEPKYDEFSEFQARCDEDCTRFFMYDPERNMDVQVRLQVSNVLLRVNQSALNSRGWVLQEVVLSSRLLHCTRQELYWKCRCRCESEMGMTYVPFSTRHKLPRLRSDHLDEAIGTWYKWVQNYTPRAFSKSTDRVPALAGITRYYQSVTNDTPALGLWKSTFSKDLEWRPVKSGKMHQYETSALSNLSNLPGIPTWSWLCCASSIDFGFGPATNGSNAMSAYHTILEDFCIEWESEPLTSLITSSKLVVKGPTSHLAFKLHGPESDHTGEQQVFRISCSTGDLECRLHFDRDIAMSTISFQCLLLRSITDGATFSEIFLLLIPQHEGHFSRAGLGCVMSNMSFSGLFNHQDVHLMSVI